MKFGFRCVTVEEPVRIPCGAVLQDFRNLGESLIRDLQTVENLNITELQT